MSRPPYPTYPHQHPHHGRPFVVVHKNDVLCGRGVNIAQHPGNERFRALVNTRQDESYCTNFTTSEKRALAEEIINHIKALNPPGRFLKRTGRSQSSRGLNGPWEELSHRECIKKTCQALRDCNRNDRQGYAAQVYVPQDVQQSAQVRNQSGLSLKQHAAAAVAKAHPSSLHPHHVNLNPSTASSVSYPPPPPHLHYGHHTPATSVKRSRDESSSSSDDRLSPSGERAAEWLKKPRTNDTLSLPTKRNVPQTTDSGAHAIHTPAPLVAPVPVSTTPGHPYMHHPYHYGIHHSSPDHHVPVLSHSASPHLSPPVYAEPHDQHHRDHDNGHRETVYSPAALLTPQERSEAHQRKNCSSGDSSPIDDPPTPDGIDHDESHFSDHNCHNYGEHHHHHHHSASVMHHFNHEAISNSIHESDDALHPDDLMHNHPDHVNSFLGGDDINHESLSIADL